MAANDAETSNSHKAQKKLGKQVNRARYDRYVTSLDGLPTHARSPEEIGPFGESETQRMRKGQVTESVRTRSCRVVTSEAGGRSMRHASPGVPVCRATTSGDRGALGDAGRRHLGIEEHLTATCPTCGAADANTRHARLCHRAGAQVNEHQPLVHATSLFLKRMSVRHQVASGAPFNADRDLSLIHI